MKFRLATHRHRRRVRELTEAELDYEAHVSVGDEGHIRWAANLMKPRAEMATADDIDEVEAAYGQSLDELVAEAEAGYDPAGMVRTERADKEQRKGGDV